MSFSIKDDTLLRFNDDEETAIVPEGVKTIRKRAFNMCRKLRKVVLPESLKTIETQAIYHCQHIECVEINGQPTIKRMAFEDSGVKEYTVGRSAKYKAVDGVLFDIKKNELVLYPSHKETEEYYVPEGTSSVAFSAFNGMNYYVCVVYLPKSVLSVPKNSFSFTLNNRPYGNWRQDPKYFHKAWDEEMGFYVYQNGMTAYYDPAFAKDLPGGIYLGGSLEDLPESEKQHAVNAFLYAMRIGIHEIETYKQSYFNYIKEHETEFINVGDEYSLRLMLNEKLISAETAETLLDHPYLKKNQQLLKEISEYVRSIPKTHKPEQDKKELHSFHPMHIPESIRWAADVEGTFNHVYVFTPAAIKEQVYAALNHEYTVRVRDEMEELLDAHLNAEFITLYNDEESFVSLEDPDEIDDDDEENSSEDEKYWSFDTDDMRSFFHMKVESISEGWLFSYGTPAYHDTWGDWVMGISEAMKESLKAVRDQYPDISYYGYEGFCARDSHSGETYEHEFYSSQGAQPEPDEYLINTLKRLWKNEDFWEAFSEDDVNENELVDFIRRFRSFMEDGFITVLLENVEDDQVREKVQELLQQEG